MEKYDYLIVGSGLFGAVFAYEMNKIGKKCLVIEKRSHIGGNVYTEEIENINVHKYGPHIFHTNKKEIWDYLEQFTVFNRYTYSPIANYNGEIYNLPFNMNTFYKMWGIKTPNEAKEIIEEQKKKANIINPKNLEETAISLVGIDIYEKLIKGYTEKQWGRKCCDLPSFIIKRLPVRFTYDNNYFNDLYQGIPIGGYTQIIEKMLNTIEVKLNTDFFEDRDKWNDISNKIVYTGMIDQYFDYCFGELEYRSLKFEEKVKNSENYQGNAAMNFTDSNIPYTRIIEHKHFENSKSEKTVITKEFPSMWNKEMEPYYPINDEKNNTIFQKYFNLSKNEKNVIFGGRLAEYQYYDMWEVVNIALNTVKKELNSNITF